MLNLIAVEVFVDGSFLLATFIAGNGVLYVLVMSPVIHPVLAY